MPLDPRYAINLYKMIYRVWCEFLLTLSNRQEYSSFLKGKHHLWVDNPGLSPKMYHYRFFIGVYIYRYMTSGEASDLHTNYNTTWQGPVTLSWLYGLSKVQRLRDEREVYSMVRFFYGQTWSGADSGFWRGGKFRGKSEKGRQWTKKGVITFALYNVEVQNSEMGGAHLHFF